MQSVMGPDILCKLTERYHSLCNTACRKHSWKFLLRNTSTHCCHIVCQIHFYNYCACCQLLNPAYQDTAGSNKCSQSWSGIPLAFGASDLAFHACRDWKQSVMAPVHPWQLTFLLHPMHSMKSRVENGIRGSIDVSTLHVPGICQPTHGISPSCRPHTRHNARVLYQYSNAPQYRFVHTLLPVRACGRISGEFRPHPQTPRNHTIADRPRHDPPPREAPAWKNGPGILVSSMFFRSLSDARSASCIVP